MCYFLVIHEQPAECCCCVVPRNRVGVDKSNLFCLSCCGHVDWGNLAKELYGVNCNRRLIPASSSVTPVSLGAGESTDMHWQTWYML